MMILIKKIDKYSLDFILNYEGVNSLTEYCKSNLELPLEVDLNSTGFSNKKLRYIHLHISELGIIRQNNQVLSLYIDQEDLEYLQYRLTKYKIDNDFIPAELFNLTHQTDNSTINIYLKNSVE